MMLPTRVCWHTLNTDWLPVPLRTRQSQLHIFRSRPPLPEWDSHSRLGSMVHSGPQNLQSLPRMSQLHISTLTPLFKAFPAEWFWKTTQIWGSGEGLNLLLGPFLPLVCFLQATTLSSLQRRCFFLEMENIHTYAVNVMPFSCPLFDSIHTSNYSGFFPIRILKCFSMFQREEEKIWHLTFQNVQERKTLMHLNSQLLSLFLSFLLLCCLSFLTFLLMRKIFQLLLFENVKSRVWFW